MELKKTQQDFIQQCPVVSQVTSIVQLVSGDKSGALETQKKCLGTINSAANSIPGVVCTLKDLFIMQLAIKKEQLMQLNHQLVLLVS
jgi:hypothetical protein